MDGSLQAVEASHQLMQTMPQTPMPFKVPTLIMRPTTGASLALVETFLDGGTETLSSPLLLSPTRKWTLLLSRSPVKTQHLGVSEPVLDP